MTYFVRSGDQLPFVLVLFDPVVNLELKLLDFRLKHAFWPVGLLQPWNHSEVDFIDWHTEGVVVYALCQLGNTLRSIIIQDELPDIVVNTNYVANVSLNTMVF